MLLADREELWTRLEKLGEKKARELLIANQFEAHEEEDVQEWLVRRTAVGAIKETKVKKWAAVIGAVAAAVATIASAWGIFKRVRRPNYNVRLLRRDYQSMRKSACKFETGIIAV